MDTNKNKTEPKTSDKTTEKVIANITTEGAEAPGKHSPPPVTENNKKANTENNPTASHDMKKPPETAKEGSLFKFFMDSLKDMYYAEKYLKEALTKMQKAATTEELQDAFEDHYLVTTKQVSRLEKVFKIIGEAPEEKKCDAILGIVKEAEKIIQETEEGSMTRDAALIIAAQKAEHYEIASYGGLAALAETMGLYKASDLLHKSLQEEEETDRELTEIAENYINFSAAEDDEDEEEDYDDEDEYDDEEDEEEEEEYEEEE